MSLRIVVAVACGMAIGAAVVSQAAGLFRSSPLASVPPQAVERAATVATRPVPAAVPLVQGPSPRPAPDPYAAPPTPAMVRSAPSASAAPGRIYRCRVNGTTTYSGESCPNGQVVDGSSAVDGFDSRPSANLERLVANGREAIDAVPPPNRVARAVSAPIGETGECASMRRQIVDLDQQALYPNSARTLDDLRRVRQDIRTSMARLHC